MSITNKILLAIGALIAAALLSVIVYQQFQLKSQQSAIQNQVIQQQQLVDGIARSQDQYATKADISKFVSMNDLNLKAIQDNLSKLNASVSSINVIVADSIGQKGNNIPSSNVGPVNPKPPITGDVPCPNGGTVKCPNTDPFEYQRAEQDLTLNENFDKTKVPIGTVGFSAWQQNPWNINILPREYNVDTVVGTDENQKQIFYNKFTVKVNEKEYIIPIKTATTKQEYPSPTFSFWNPRLLMGLDGGVNVNHVQGEFVPNINVGIMSYGQYKTTPDLSVLEVGVGYGTVNKTGELIITPVAYNIGKKLFSPFMNNTYIGPSVMVGTDGSFVVGAGLRVGF